MLGDWCGHGGTLGRICWLSSLFLARVGMAERRNIDRAITAGARRPRERLIPNPKLRFLDQCREVLRTEEAYVDWIRRFIVWAKDHPPADGQPHLTPALSPPSEGAEREKKWRHPKEIMEVPGGRARLRMASPRSGKAALIGATRPQDAPSSRSCSNPTLPKVHGRL